MRLEEITGQLQNYFFLALCGVALLALVFLLGYIVVYKKWMKGEKRLDLKRAVLWGMLAGYIIVVLCLTILSRDQSFSGRVNLHLFSAWREAWNTAQLTSWQMLVFNIVMFMPLGILLPLVSVRFQRAVFTVGAGVLFTLGIESFQLATGWGVFELDDMFLNTLGALVGYGIVMAVLTLAGGRFGPSRSGGGRKTTGKGLRIILYLLPILLTAGVFTGLAAVYQLSEYGNLNAYSYARDMSGVTVSLNAELSEMSADQMVYRVHVMNADEGESYARELLGKLGADPASIGVNARYNDNALFQGRRADGSASWLLWLYYTGGCYRLTEFRDKPSEETRRPESNWTEKQVLTALVPLGVNLPAEGDIEVKGDEFTIKTEGCMDGGSLIRGTLSGRMGGEADGSEVWLASFQNRMLTYDEYKKAPLLSEKEAYSRLTEGKFNLWTEEEVKSLLINAVSLTYSLDTKGFYQPVYLFHVTVNGEQNYDIMIPALKR